MIRVVLASFLCCMVAMSAVGESALGASPEEATATDALQTPDQIFAAVLRQSIGAPARAEIGDQATVRLSEDLVFVLPESGARLLTVLHRQIPDHFMGLLIGSEGIDAPGIIQFVPAGFIDSDAALAWTEDDMLASLDDTVQRGNPELIRNGLPQREARRWIVPPHYNPEMHQISWAPLIVPRSAPRGSDGEITYHAVSFGRQGYVELAVVSGTQNAEAIAHMGDRFLLGLNFRPGHSYLDAVPSDAQAKDGLAGAMGFDSLHKAQSGGGFLAGDAVVPMAGGSVAAVGALSLFFYIRRHLRREARRG